MRNAPLFTLAAAVFAVGCIPTVTGAPCTTDANCPSGQVCSAGKCGFGTGSGGNGGSGGGVASGGGTGGNAGGGAGGGAAGGGAGGGAAGGGAGGGAAGGGAGGGAAGGGAGGGAAGGGAGGGAAGGGTGGGAAGGGAGGGAAGGGAGGGAAGGGAGGGGPAPASLALAPPTQDFGLVTVNGQSGTQTFTLQNTGGMASGMITTALTGTDAAQFGITSDGCSGQVLAANATCQIGVRFSPTTAMAKSATLTATASPGGMASSALSGTGLTPGNITINPLSKDFGAVEQNVLGATQIFTVQNTGGSATGALVTAVTGTDKTDFTVTADTCSAQALAAMGSCTVTVQFAPSTPGSKIGTLTVTGTPGGAAAAPLSGDALASAQLAVSPPSQNYNSVVTGSTTAATFTVTNTGGVPSGIPAAMLNGTDAAQFSIGMNTCSAVLAPMGTCSITVRFTPTTTGAKSASLNVSASPGGAASAMLTGTGVSPGALSISPPNQDFGSLLQGTSSAAPISFTVTNTGGSSTGALQTRIVAAGAPEFSIVFDTCLNQVLTASGTCTVSVRFSPTSSGPKSATLEVEGMPGGLAPASLTGTGLAPAQLSISPPSFTFPSTVVGATSTPQSFVVTNTGGVAAGTTTALAAALGMPNAGDFQISGNTCTGTLAANATCSVTVAFKPTASGVRSSAVNVTATPGGVAAASISGTGQTPAALTLSVNAPNSVNFGNVAVGASSTMTYVAGNSGQQTTSAITVVLSGADYTLLSGSAGDCASGSTTLTGGGTCNIRVQFSPSVNMVRTATLSISAGVGGSPSPLSLTGTGQNPGVLTGNPGSKDFSGIEVNQSSMPSIWTITNGGNLPATSLVFSNTNATEFLTSTTCGTTLAAMSSCQVTITFKPSAGGNRSGTLQMAYAEGPSITMSVLGAGLFRLTVTPTGTGGVTSNIGPISCGATCTGLYPLGSAVTLAARTNNGNNSFFSAWGGDCAAAGSFRDCVVQMTQTRTVSATFSPMTNNLAFVSSRTYNGGNAIGSVANADAECNSMATAAGINNAAGTGFGAWISSSTSNALTRLGVNARGWMRIDNRPVFDSQAEIAANQIWHPINRTEQGAIVTSDVYVATGTNGNGTTASSTCSDWTMGAGQFGAFGNVNHGPGNWSLENNFGCGFVLRLYCLGKTKTAILNPAPFVGAAKYAFVTVGQLAPNAVSGPAEYDALCNAEKPAGSGTFKAWLAQKGIAASGILVATTNYYTVEKQLIGTGAEINSLTFSADGAGMWELSDATFPSGLQKVYTGSTAPSNAGSDPTTCASWSSTATTGTYGFFTLGDNRFWNFSTQACTTASHVHCIEQ